MIEEKYLILLRKHFEKSLIDDLLGSYELNFFDKGDIIINYCDSLKYIPIVMEGVIKVMKEDPDYGEGLLYYIMAGDTCSISTSCFTGYKKSKIKAICETKAKIFLISSNTMNDWMLKYDSWRSYVINSYQKRFDELFNVINSISFDNLEERINDYIQKKGSILSSKKIKTTHEEIANELGTSRVVVSRILKLLENKSILKLGRNSIELL
jgi:CRP/FNR family transcriptional regulator